MLEPPVYRLLDAPQLLQSAHTLCALVDHPPDAVSVRIDLAAPVFARAAAGAISHLFRASHRACKRSIAQNALAAVMALEYRLLDHVLSKHRAGIKPGVALAKRCYLLT